MVNQYDAVPIQAYHRFTNDGLFRLLVFPGDLSQGMAFSRYTKLGEWLASSLTPSPRLEIITIHAAKRGDVELIDLHPVFRPWSVEEGWNYWCVYADDDSYHKGHGRVYERLGIGKEEGLLVFLRSDEYISLICGFEEAGALVDFFKELKPKARTRPGATEGWRQANL